MPESNAGGLLWLFPTGPWRPIHAKVFANVYFRIIAKNRMRT